jgi:transcriptional regulator with XRE-family HTH domain
MKQFDGSAFREWRTQHSLTQDQAADLVGVTVYTVRSWEQGVRPPPRNVALLIERLKPSDFPKDVGSAGNRPVGIATKNLRKAKNQK